MVTYNFRWARFFIQVNETLVIVVTPGAQEAHLPRAFVEDRRILESLLLGQHAARGILLLVEEVQVVAMVRDQEGLVLCSALLRRSEIQLSRSHNL